jgi:hypothetical protein
MEFHNCSLEAVRALCAEVEWLQDRVKILKADTLPPDEWYESVLSSLDDLNAWGERIGLGKWLENFAPDVRAAFVMLAEDAADLIRGLLRKQGDTPGFRWALQDIADQPCRYHLLYQLDACDERGDPRDKWCMPCRARVALADEEST